LIVPRCCYFDLLLFVVVDLLLHFTFVVAR